MAGEYNLSVIMSAQDKASSIVQGFLSNLGPVGGVVAGVAATLIGVGAASISMAGDFQASMIKSQAEAGLTQAQVTQMGNAILAMAPQVGQAPKQLADGLFFVESAGFAGKDALDTLRLSAQMAANDMTDTSTVAKGLTTAVKAFGYQTSQSAFVANQMTVTVANGKLTMAEYATNIGKVALTAHSFGVSMSETNAGLDTLTNNGFPSAARASTALNALFQQFDGNTATVAKNIKALGIQGFDETKFKAMNFGQQVQYLNTTMKGHEDQLKKVLGGNQTAAAAFQALSGNTSMYKDILGKLNDAQQKGGAETQAFAATQQGWNFKMQQAQAATQVLMIQLGQYLIPIVEQVGGYVMGLVANFANWITTSGVIPGTINAIKTAVQIAGDIINGMVTAVKNVVTWYNNWKPIINTVAGIITGFFVPALIKVGVEAGIAGVKLAVGFVQSMITSGVQAVISAAKVTSSFIASMIQAGIEGWASAGKLAAFIGAQIATGVQSTIAQAKIVGGIVVGFIASGVQSTIANAKIMGGIVAGFIATGVQSIIAQGKIIGGIVVAFIASGVQSGIAAAKMVGSFVAGLIVTAAQSLATAATIAGSFIVSLINAGIEIAITAGAMMIELVPALAAVALEALLAAAPFILIGLIIAAVVIGIILVIQHWSQIMTGLKVVWSAVSGVLQAGLKILAGVWAGIWHGMQIVFAAIWDGIVAAAKIAALVLFVIITGPIGLLVLYIITHWTQVHAWLIAAWDMLKSKAGEFVNGVVNFITQLPGKVGDLLTSMRNKAMDIFNNLLQDALNFGSNIIKNVAAGITNAIHFVTGAITNVTQWISDHLPHSPAKIGPLKDLAYQGQQIVQQISEGMLLNAPKMQMAMSQIVQPVMSTVSNAVSGAPSLTGAPNVSNSNSGGNVANITINFNSQTKNDKDRENEIVQVLSQALRSSGIMVNTPSGRRY